MTAKGQCRILRRRFEVLVAHTYEAYFSASFKCNRYSSRINNYNDERGSGREWKRYFPYFRRSPLLIREMEGIFEFFFLTVADGSRPSAEVSSRSHRKKNYGPSDMVKVFVPVSICMTIVIVCSRNIEIFHTDVVIKT